MKNGKYCYYKDYNDFNDKKIIISINRKLLLKKNNLQRTAAAKTILNNEKNKEKLL